MHTEILVDEQRALMPLVHDFSRKFGLVGGTAIALHLGHRRSIDFDLFTAQDFSSSEIRRVMRRHRHVPRVLRDESGQYTVIINGVFFTFYQYLFPVTFPRRWPDVIRLPDLLTLAAMKAHALGRRAKWKDYVDLYFILENSHTMKQIVTRAKRIFKKEFNEHFFRQQLSYFQDIDYSETIEFMPGFAVDKKKVQRRLIEESLR